MHRYVVELHKLHVSDRPDPIMRLGVKVDPSVTQTFRNTYGDINSYDRVIFAYQSADSKIGYLLKHVDEFPTIYGPCSLRSMEVREGTDVTEFLFS